MNILIPESWLKEFLITKANPKQIAEYLSLCSQSVEKTIIKGKDHLYDIEITTNRPDCLSVYGIARELNVILPQFGIKTELKPIIQEKINFPNLKKPLPLKVKIENQSLCPRFTALIFDQVEIKPSQEIIKKRLEAVGIRALNNVIDISNYLMIELGQPMHTFDYDKIKKSQMILRESKTGEEITTIDNQKRSLPKGTIVIEDGENKIIDLCGIMGGANSEVDEKTKKVLLFIQTYDPVKIRQTCQQLSFRTDAAARFEKGVDPEGVIMAMERATQMFKDNCNAQIASNLIDIYPKKQKTKEITLEKKTLQEVTGLDINLEQTKQTLEKLGFKIKNQTIDKLEMIIPHWRYDDINIQQDLIEEIARIYGYHNLPSNMLSGKIPLKTKTSSLIWQRKTKDLLKFANFNETYSYSMVSEKQLKLIGFDKQDLIEIANPLTEEWIFMRPTLIGCLLEIIANNQNQQTTINIFETANTYVFKSNEQLPEENLNLAALSNEYDFYQMKGILESLLEELNIKNYEFRSYNLEKTFYGKAFQAGKAAEIIIDKEPIGIIGTLSPLILNNFDIKKNVNGFEIEFKALAKFANLDKEYKPLSKYPEVVEDLSIVTKPETLVGKLIDVIKSNSPLINKVDLIDSYQETRTFRIYYQNQEKNLTDKEVAKIRGKIIKKIKQEFGLELKTKER